MSNKIIVTKTSTMVDVFYVPDTPENRQAVERGEYDKVIYNDPQRFSCTFERL